MKIQVAKRDLETALQVVSSSLGSGSEGDISTHFLFRARKEGKDWKAEVLTYTERLCAGAPFIAKVEVEDDGPTAFTIPGWRIKGVLSVFPDAALTFEYDDESKMITYRGPRGEDGSIQFESLDPDDYPYWDAGVKEAKSVAKIPAASLRRAVMWARPFVLLDSETRRPDLCVFESREGTIHASNMKSAALVTVPGMKDSALRVHGGDAPKIVSFLDTFGEEGEVEILESDLALYLKRGDGAVFGETRYNVKFPDNMKMGQVDVDPLSWEFPISELKDSIHVLLHAANKDDNRLRFKSGKKETLILEMLRNSGNGNARQSIPLVDSGAEEDAPELTNKGFMLDHNELKRVLSIQEDANLRMGIHPRGKSGFVRFAVSQDEIDCQIILAWLRE